MEKQGTSLLVRFRELVEKIKQAKAEINPFKAKALKNEIEPQIEPMALEAVELLHTLKSNNNALENRCVELQKQINRLDSRLSDLGG